jgi:hypothetical protein
MRRGRPIPAEISAGIPAMIRRSARRLPGLLLLLGCGTEPPSTSLAHIVAGTVLDSLGAPVPEVQVSAVQMRQGDSIGRGWGTSDAAGVYSIDWFTPAAHHYDSLMIVAYGDGSLSNTSPCRPYSLVQLTRTPDQLQNLPADSAHIPIELGLTRESPTLASGIFVCAEGYKPFGDIVSDFLVELAIETVGPAPDSIRGQWQIAFRETRGTLDGEFAGLASGGTLDLALHLAPDSFIECEPGYRLRIVLDQDQRFGEGEIETLRPDVQACPIEQLYPLRFVAYVPPLFAKRTNVK